jgi:hypothetical protein
MRFEKLPIPLALSRVMRTLCLLAGLAFAPALASPQTPAATPPTPPAPKAAPAPPAVRPPAIHDIATRLDLREPFNAAQGKVRIIAFLSPTCSHCFVNAQSLQNDILDKMPGADIVVYAVWLKILDSDDRAAINAAATVLHDARVQHYWDPKRTLNAQLLDSIYLDVQVRMYNIFLLYGRQATWDTHLPRAGFWMQSYKGAPGPEWKASTMAEEIGKAMRGEALDTPQPP